MPQTEIYQLPETEYMAATEHRIPKDGYDHKFLKCPCEPQYERRGNKVIVQHIEVVDKRA